MPYCTQDDILEQVSLDELIGLTDDDNAGAVDDSTVSRAVANADAEIDSYCGARYPVPFSTVPVRVRLLSVDIALYYLYRRRHRIPDDIRQAYTDAIAFLRDVSKGSATLGADAPEDSDAGGPAATTDQSDRVFTRGRSSAGTTGSLDNY